MSHSSLGCGVLG